MGFRLLVSRGDSELGWSERGGKVGDLCGGWEAGWEREEERGGFQSRRRGDGPCRTRQRRSGAIGEGEDGGARVGP
jgi:hypothetical protein